MERPEGQRPPSSLSLHSTPHPQSAADAEWHPSISFPPFHVLQSMAGREAQRSALFTSSGACAKIYPRSGAGYADFLDEFVANVLGEAAAFRLIQNANASFQMRRIVQTADGSMAESLETE